MCVTRLFQETGNALHIITNAFTDQELQTEAFTTKTAWLAHRTYPLGTLLHKKPRNEKKEVVVKVTDRGPYSKRLMIDLSYKAAKELDITLWNCSGSSDSHQTDTHSFINPTTSLTCRISASYHRWKHSSLPPHR